MADLRPVIRLTQRPRLGRGARARLRLGGTLAIGQVIGRGALALALLLLIRQLPPEQFSVLALALALVAILGSVADAGFARLLVRDTARAGESKEWLVRELLRVRMAPVVGTAVLSVIGLAIVPNPFGLAFAALLVAYLVLESVALGYESAAAGAERPWRFVAAQTIAATTLIGSLLVLIAEDAVSLNSAIAVMSGASAMKVGGHVLAWRHRRRPVQEKAQPLVAAALYRQALPFLGLTIISTLYYKVGIVALYAVQGASETAPYAAALRLVDGVALVGGAAFLAVSPTFSRMHRDRPQLVWLAWRRTVTTVALLAVPCAGLLAVAAEPVCALLFGERYRVSAASDLRLMLPGVALMLMQAVSAAVVMMADDHRDVLKLGAFNLAACTVAAVALSATLGSAGAAGAFTLAEVASFASFAWLIHRRHFDGARLEAA